MRNHTSIVANMKDKTLTLALPHNLPKGLLITPYLAMYKYKYENFTFTNYTDWFGDEVNIETLVDKTEKLLWESLNDGVIVCYTSEMYEEELIDLIDEIRGLPQFLLEVRRGKILLEDNHDENKLKPFGEGKYYYKATENSKKQDIIGYEGEYLVCTLDMFGHVRSGDEDGTEQLIYIPFK